MLLEQKRVKEEEEEEEDEGDKEQSGRSSQESQVASARLEEVKTSIDLQDLFKDRSVHPDNPVQAVQRILLTSDPGTGKTTLSKKLAYQWSVGTWGQEFHSLYLLSARSLQQGL